MTAAVPCASSTPPRPSPPATRAPPSGLAYAAAASNLTTVLVDATGDGGDITKFLDLETNRGFTDVLAEDITVEPSLVS